MISSRIYPASVDLYFHDTYFVMGNRTSAPIYGGVFFLICSTVYHFYPRLVGRKLSKTLGQFHFWATFLGLWVFLLCATHLSWGQLSLEAYLLVARVLFAGMLTIVAAQFLFFFNLVWSLFRGERT